MVKTRDAFDIRLLLTQGAKLDAVLKGHLHDALMWREMDREQITERIEKVDARLCRAELKPVLPDDVYAELEGEGFESLRAAVRSVFGGWLWGDQEFLAWAATLRKEALRASVLRSDELARRYGISAAEGGN